MKVTLTIRCQQAKKAKPDWHPSCCTWLNSSDHTALLITATQASAAASLFFLWEQQMGHNCEQQKIKSSWIHPTFLLDTQCLFPQSAHHPNPSLKAHSSQMTAQWISPCATGAFTQPEPNSPSDHSESIEHEITQSNSLRCSFHSICNSKDWAASPAGPQGDSSCCS